MSAQQIETVSTLLTALGALGAPATAALAVLLKRSDARKMRRLDEVANQVKANGGASLSDAVDRIEQAVFSLTERIEVLETERVARRRWRP